MATLNAAASSRAAPKRNEVAPAMDCLGDDVLCLVLERLSTRALLRSPALVCKRWAQLCKALVTEFSPPPFLARLPPSKSSAWLHLRGPEAAHIVERHAATLETLDLRYLGAAAKHSPGSEPGIACLALIPRLPRLRTLVVPALELGRHLHLSALPHTLTTLRFTHDPADYTKPTVSAGCVWCWLDNHGLRTILERCPNLENVRFGMCRQGIRDNVIRQFLEALAPSLTHVSLEYSELGRIWDDTVQVWEEVEFVLLTCQRLESLEVKGPLFRPPPSPRDWAVHGTYGVSRLHFSFPPRLRMLRLLNNKPKSDQGLQYGLQWFWTAVQVQGHQLHELAFQGMGQLLDLSVAPNLTMLDWGNTFWLRGSEVRFSKSGAQKLLTVLAGLPRLERVVLADATDEMLVALGQHCPRLREIHVHGPEFDDRPLKRGLPRHPRVEEVTNRGVIALAEGCPRLRVVHVGHSLVDAGAVRALAFHCRDLRALFLTGCLPTKKLVGIADDAVQALLPRLASRLQLLDLAGTGITPPALKALYGWAQEHPFPLRVLVLPSRPAIQTSSWAPQLKALPYLDVRFGASGLRWAGLHTSTLLAD